ncbi:MAG: phage virion morphogenesis protein [Rhodospirillaceae bacterium]|nr:phage virion morphogenesis protein [Rhodospirillaceae bacterium]
MSAVLSFRLDDIAAKAELARLEHVAADPQPIMDAIGAGLVTSTQMRFEQEQGPDGNPWPRSIRAIAEGGSTLRKSARLYQSITHRATASQVEVGTNVIYAAVHQFGAKIVAKAAKGLRFKIGDMWVTKRSVTIPARPFLGIGAGDREMIVDVIADALRAAQ